MIRIRSVVLSVALLLSPYAYGVHAHVIRYNNSCLHCEHRGDLDSVDAVIFTRKPMVNYDHVLATPVQYIAAKKDLIDTWRAHALQAIIERNAVLLGEAQAAGDGASDALNAAVARLSRQAEYLQYVEYPQLEAEGLIAVPEQDIVFLMQWAERIVVSGDELMPIISVVLDQNTALVVTSNDGGDLPAVLRDHIYWQRVIEAGWVAVDTDTLERVQPVLHPNVIGDKFHFYKTRFGIYFRETLGTEEAVPGDLLRIVKYLQRDPRHNEHIHGKSAIVWLKFPSDKDFNPTLDGQYIPNAARASTASWVYAHDLQALYAELNNQK